jgi:glycosyltransferase involved in cell wall biosynthesis
MNMFLEISLVIATYGRYKELDDLLNSLVDQVGQPLFEVIIVDQNDHLDLNPLINKYRQILNIVHFKSSIKRLANAKNIGIKLSKAPLITFPDDDCKFYPDTIISALKFLNLNDKVDIVYGRIFDREANKNIMREWSLVPKTLNKYNFHLNYSAVTCFSRRNDLLFDENFGVGSKFGVGEELDYIMSALNNRLKVVYEPGISVWHPELNVNVMTNEKVRYYAFGYGAVFRKNRSFPYTCIFIGSLAYQLVDLFIGLAKGNIEQVKKRSIAFLARIQGFMSY